MKLLSFASDGGENSGVLGFFFVEIKAAFSIVLLRFSPGSREAYHSHAFNAVTWFISGYVEEQRLEPSDPDVDVRRVYGPSWRPKFTARANCHRVYGITSAFAISFRGPWVDTWREYRPAMRRFITLTHGRKVIG